MSQPHCMAPIYRQTWHHDFNDMMLLYEDIIVRANHYVYTARALIKCAVINIHLL